MRYEPPRNLKRSLTQLLEAENFGLIEAEEVAAHAAATGPVDEGDFTGGFRVDDIDGAGHVVYNTDVDFFLVETGWGPTPAYRTTVASIEALGMRWSPE